MFNHNKSELVTLYIKPEHYNSDYNFYNYHKFKATGIINIIYKTPSIFLNGLYFELPYVQVMEITKHPGTTSFEMKLCFTQDSLASSQEIINIMTHIDKFNTNFFRENASKFEIKTNQTNKSNQYIKHVINSNDSYESKVLDSRPRFRNPFIKKYGYKSFMNENIDKQVCITVEIKHIYMLKICELIKANEHLLCDDANKKMLAFTNQVIQFINQEFYDFRKSSYAFNLQQEHINLNMKFWVKSNNLEIKNNNLNMIWKICGYQI